MAVSTAPRPGAAKVRLPRKRRLRNDEDGSLATYFIALVVIAATLGPVLFVVLAGFRTNAQMTGEPGGLPSPWVFDNYRLVLQSPEFWNEFVNSIVVAAATTAGVIGFGLMASYALARYEFVGRGFLFGLFATGLMFPLTVAITPLYLQLSKMGLLNNPIGLVLPQIGFGLPTTIIILVPFLKAIPHEIEEAAAMDGCSRLGFFVRMVVPLARPGLLTTGILAFIASWNAYLLPLYVLSGDTLTLPLGIQAFQGDHYTDTAQILAFTSMAMLPALLVFTLFERRIVGGLQGAVKG